VQPAERRLGRMRKAEATLGTAMHIAVAQGVVV
jgi:hypothetical protein